MLVGLDRVAMGGVRNIDVQYDGIINWSSPMLILPNVTVADIMECNLTACLCQYYTNNIIGSSYAYNKSINQDGSCTCEFQTMNHQCKANLLTFYDGIGGLYVKAGYEDGNAFGRYYGGSFNSRPYDWSVVSGKGAYYICNLRIFNNMPTDSVNEWIDGYRWNSSVSDLVQDDRYSSLSIDVDFSFAQSAMALYAVVSNRYDDNLYLGAFDSSMKLVSKTRCSVGGGAVISADNTVVKARLSVDKEYKKYFELYVTKEYTSQYVFAKGCALPNFQPQI